MQKYVEICGIHAETWEKVGGANPQTENIICEVLGEKDFKRCLTFDESY